MKQPTSSLDSLGKHSVAEAPKPAALPLHLDSCTDPDHMRQQLQDTLPGYGPDQLRITGLRVRDVRRNTSQRRNPCAMTLCYELQVSHTQKQQHQPQQGTQLLLAQVFRDPVAAASCAALDPSRLVRPAFGQALSHLPALNMVLWALPNDPALPQLAQLLDPAQAVALMPSSLQAPTCSAVQVTMVRYAPQQRATLRYTLDGGVRKDDAAGAAMGTPSRTVYAKTFHDDRAALIHQRFNHFWQLSLLDTQAPLVAQPLPLDGPTHTLWQDPAPGTPLLPWLSTADGPSLIVKVAQALALLHAAPLAPSLQATPRSAAYWVAEARRRQKKITRIDASLASQAACVADSIDTHAAHPAARTLSLIHGDFHPEQIAVHDGRIVLFDFDEFTLGDPMEDLAEFVLKLEALEGAAAALAPQLIQAYAAAAPQRFDRRCLDWHLTVQSLLQASRALVYQQPGWPQLLRQRLASSVARANQLQALKVAS